MGPLPLLAVEEQGQLPLDELRTFADVYNQIRTGYVEEIDDSTLLEYAIQGMLMGAGWSREARIRLAIWRFSGT